MKYTYIILGLLFSLGSIAQNKQTKKADQLFESHQYAAAIDAYEGLVKNKKANAFVYKQLAASYYSISNMEKAAHYYQKATESSQDAETYYNYAQALKTQGNYSEAKKQLDKFASLLPNDHRAKNYLANPDYISDLQSKDKLFDVSETSLNTTGSSDFAAVLGQDNVVYFVSTRNDSNKTDTWSGAPYLDIYQSNYADGTLTKPIPVDELNSNYHDGPITISTDGTVMFFSRDGLVEGSFEKSNKTNTKIGKLGIYRAEKKNGKWTNIKPLPFNSTTYSVGNPSLSRDGKTLYFASDMPGGLGDTDIWKVSINSGGSYGKPVNLGSGVNTEGKESFPFIADDNVLYFASNGKLGLGGFDVFKISLDGNGEAENLGQPINSNKDDFAFSLNTEKRIGFFASNRAGTDNIYFAEPLCKSETNIIVKDAITKQTLQGVTVLLTDNDATLKTETTTYNGSVSFNVECDKGYGLQLTLKEYEAQSVALENVNGINQIEILLQPLTKEEVIITDKEVVLQPILFEFNKSTITKASMQELDKLVNVMNKYPEMVILVKSHTDTKGNASYNLNLSEQRAQATVEYVISKGITKNRVSGKGFGENEPKVDCGNDCTEEQDAQNRRSEFIIVKD